MNLRRIISSGRLSMAAGVIAVAAVGAAELNFTMKEFSAPSFDATGRLLRRLTAASAAGPTSTPQLEAGRVEFFDAVSTSEPRAILTFDHALYNKSAETIRGDDGLKLVDNVRQETLSGQGHESEIAKGRLTLRSTVKWESARFKLTGDRAEVRFDPKAAKQEALIREAVVTGEVTLERATTKDQPFERATTSEARYDAAAQKIYLRSPVTVWKDGVRTPWDVKAGFVEIDLIEKK